MSLFNMSTRPKNRYVEEQKRKRAELERQLASMPYEVLYKKYMEERKAEESPYVSWGNSEPYKNELLKRPEYQAKLAEEERKYEERMNKNYLEKKAKEEKKEAGTMKNISLMHKYTTKNIATDFNPKKLPITKLEEQEKDKFFQHCLITKDYVNDVVYDIALNNIYNPNYIKAFYKKELKWADYFLRARLIPSIKERNYNDRITKGKYRDINFPCIEADDVDSHFFEKDKEDLYKRGCKEYCNIEFTNVDYTFNIETAFMFLKDIEKYGYDANFQNYDIPEYELRAILRYRQERKITREEFLNLSEYGKLLCIDFILEEKLDLGIFMLSKPIYLDYSKIEKWAKEQMNLFLKRELGIGSVGNKHTDADLWNNQLEKRYWNDPYVDIELAKDKQCLSTDYMQYPYLYPLYYYDKNNRIVELPVYYLKEDKNGDFKDYTKPYYTLKTMNEELSKSIIAYQTNDARYTDLYVKSLAELAGRNSTNFSIKDFFDYSEVYEEYMVNEQYKREQTLNKEKLFYNYYCPNYAKNSDMKYNANYSTYKGIQENFKTKEELDEYNKWWDDICRKNVEEAKWRINQIIKDRDNNRFDPNLADELITKLERMISKYESGDKTSNRGDILEEVEKECDIEFRKYQYLDKYGEPETEDDDIDSIEDTNTFTDSIDNNEEEIKKIEEEIQNRYLHNKITPGLGEEIKYKLANNLMDVDEALELLKRDKENYENVDEYNHNIE